jgi:hypothetical protein
MSLKHTVRTRYRGVNKFKKVYQSINDLVKDESGYLLAGSHYILNRWKNYYFQLLDVHRISDVRQI